MPSFLFIIIYFKKCNRARSEQLELDIRTRPYPIGSGKFAAIQYPLPTVSGSEIWILKSKSLLFYFLIQLFWMATFIVQFSFSFLLTKSSTFLFLFSTLNIQFLLIMSIIFGQTSWRLLIWYIDKFVTTSRLFKNK